MIKDIIKFIIIFTIIFIIFIELYVGNILFRLDSSNQISINISSMINYLFHPLYHSFLWNRDIIITNYPFMLSIGLCLYLLKFDYT